MNNKCLPDRVFISLSYFYLVLPILIFIIGWIKFPLNIVFVLLLLNGTLLTLRDFKYVSIEDFYRPDFLIMCLLIVVIWVVFSGIGGIGYQNWDFMYRNIVFHDLINHPWPVYYDYSFDLEMNQMFGNQGALVYYFSYWLPSALIGKLLGWEVANLILFIWTIIGISLCFYMLCRYIGKAKVWFILAFVFFSGLDILGWFYKNHEILIFNSITDNNWSKSVFWGAIIAKILDNSHLETWAWNLNQNFVFLDINSHTTQLFWVFNSSVPTWLITLMLLNNHPKRSILFTFILLLAYSPIATLGLLTYVIFNITDELWPCIKNVEKGKNLFLIRMKQNFLSFQNTISTGLVGLIFSTFYFSQLGQHKFGFLWQFLKIDLKIVIDYLVFYVLEFLIFSAFVFYNNHNKRTLIITILLLSLFPLLSFSTDNEFILKATVPPMIVFFTVGLKNIYNKYQQIESISTRISKFCLIIVFLIGSITALHEINRSRDMILMSKGNPGYYQPSYTYGNSDASSLEAKEYKMKDIHNFVVSRHNDIFFYKYLAPK